jgi:hypothetical protein
MPYELARFNSWVVLRRVSWNGLGTKAKLLTLEPQGGVSFTPLRIAEGEEDRTRFTFQQDLTPLPPPGRQQ